MSKAEERAFKEYPVFMTTLIPANDELPLIEQDCNKFTREAYIKGYHQAEKDLALTWEDIRKLDIILAEVDVEIEFNKIDIETETPEYYKEVLNRFNKQKEK